jgi:shikimate kinase
MRLSKNRNLFLVGPMAVGKTTIGKLLARELRLQFIDSDQEIEKKAGADIPWIFDVEGEEKFRDRESSVLDELTQREGILLATGGGSVLRKENRRYLQARGIVVYLDTSLDTQIRRTEKDKKRPLLQNVDHRKVLSELRDARDPIYSEVADFKVFVGDANSRKTVSSILRQLKNNDLVHE